MNYNTLLTFGEFFYQGYIVSVILNLFFTPKLSIDKKSVQNLIGILFFIGLFVINVNIILYLFKSWYGGVEYEQYAFRNRITGDYKFAYIFMLVAPLIAMLLNIKRAFRTNVVVIIFSSLIFLPRCLEILLIITRSNIYIWDINKVYLNSFIHMLIYGTLVYLLILVFIKLKKTG